jgi:SAM-dependent methyltransferase
MISRVSTILRSRLGRLRNLRGYRAEIDVRFAPEQVEITRAVPCTIGVRNAGDRTWRAGGWYPVRLSYHWRAGGHAIEGGRSVLPGDLRPGEQVVLPCAVVAPATEGDYVLEFDLVREHVGWFKSNGSPTLQLPRAVRDYDYHHTYQQVDFEKDYWSIVGPSTKEEHERLGREKRQTLIELGMTPDSRLLDVGCGTGQLTDALVDYLSDAAIYCGTDLAHEAVAFCQKRFSRPNFHFCQNEMTSVPVRDQQFDIIFLSSVFTHMYALEIQAMLIDLKRLLAPCGLIMADAFVSPHVATEAGSRSKVEHNEDRLKALFAQAGLTWELQGVIAQPDGAKRMGFVFRHGEVT